MSFRHDRLPLDPGHAKPFRPALSAPQRPLKNPCRHNTQGFPVVIVDSHLQPPGNGGNDGTEKGRGVSQVVLNPRQAVPPSPVVREGLMTQHAIAEELERLVKDAAGEIVPGMTVKAQINRACENLGYSRGNWRVRQAWYGLAENWRSEPVFDLLGRYNRLVQQRTACGSHTVQAVDPLSNLMAAATRRQ